MLFLTILCFAQGSEKLAYGRVAEANSLKITIEQFRANPEQFLGKVVTVEGTVAEVCPKAGCWLDLTEKGQTVRIKVKDGEIVFEQKLVGRKVLAEGTVYKFDLNKEQALEYFAHLAEEKGEKFDPTSAPEQATIYQIGGLGVSTL
jgi:hypothetical protein